MSNYTEYGPLSHTIRPQSLRNCGRVRRKRDSSASPFVVLEMRVVAQSATGFSAVHWRVEDALAVPNGCCDDARADDQHLTTGQLDSTFRHVPLGVSSADHPGFRNARQASRNSAHRR